MPGLHVILVGLNHRTAPLAVRERVSVPKERLADSLARLRARTGEGVVLSTCNRTEVYSVARNVEKGEAEVRRFLTEGRGIESDLLAQHLYALRDIEAARHLFRVAAGLDSMILGESEVLGQVRDALAAAAGSQSLGPQLSRLFHGAVRAGRRVREDTEVGRHSLSISFAAVQLAQRVLGDLGGLRALLVGAGEAGHLVARALRTTGVADMMVANRTPARAEELARKLGGRAVPFADLPSALQQADVAIAATEAPEYVFTRDTVASATQARGELPLFLFDLSVPRNIDPAVASIDGVKLFNIDDLSLIGEENLLARRAAAVDAERIVEEELSRFQEWWGSQETDQLIGALRLQAEVIRRRELEHALRKLAGLSEADREVVEALSRSLVTKLMHDPTRALRRRGGTAHMQVVRELFRLGGEGQGDRL